MKSVHRAGFAAACALVQAAALSAQTQHVDRVGSWDVRMQADPATGEPFAVTSATLMPEGEPEGLVMWSCTGVGLRLTVELDVAQGDTRRVAWRFGREELDSVWLQRGAGPLWHVREDQVARLTALAKTAEGMAIQVPAARGAAATERAYDLAGAREVLGRLSCARDPSTPAWTALPSRGGRPRVAPSGEGVQRTAPPDEGTYDLSAVEVQPRIRNGAAITRESERIYPPGLRDAGIGGTVSVRLRVMEDGRVDPESVQVTRTDHDALREPAIQLARQLVLTPARVNGRPVKVWIEVPLYFSVSDP
jgi:TonB family protein